MDEEVKKAHRPPAAGRKAEKKKKKLKEQGSAAAASSAKNPKAFTFHSVVRAARAIRRQADVLEKKTHAPTVDRTPVQPPPYIVAVVGPPKVGKSLLIQCLVRHYTKQTITVIKGPITVVTGKTRRITLLECGNDINTMIDVAKIADLVLMLVDASFGFEMETFEFLHICHVHGMPRIMGILTHLDYVKPAKKARQTKKWLKHRFWTEIYHGAKLFYLSGLADDRYLDNEVKNLARFIGVLKCRAPLWRTTHPYMLVDRLEDMTDPVLLNENERCDRDVCFYGYARGSAFQRGLTVHVIGVGDFPIADIGFLPDPCALPDKEKRRSLDAREKLIYAPFSGVGGILYDKDAIYVDMPKSRRHGNREDDEWVSDLGHPEKTVDARMAESTVSVFSSSQPMAPGDLSIDEDLSDEEGSSKEDEEMESTDEEEDVAKSDPNDMNGEQGMLDRLKGMFNAQPRPKVSWVKLIYSKEWAEWLKAQEEEKEELGGLFEAPRAGTIGQTPLMDRNDFSFYMPVVDEDTALVDCTSWDEKAYDSIRDCFVTGKWAEDEDANAVLSKQDSGVFDDNDELYGDFVDLETGQTIDELPKEEEADEAEERQAASDGKRHKEVEAEKSQNEARLQKKLRLKQLFNAEYDESRKFHREWMAEVDQQTQLNRAEFESLDDSLRVEYEGFRAGLYLRIRLANVPCELVRNFDPTYPYIVGGLLPGEENVGCVQVRLKKHRWHDRIMKTRDPLIMSLGWRRFQTVVLYTTQDHNGRNRLLKYTPQFMHCQAVFWGPITPQNTGFVAVQNVAGVDKHFRIAATGVVLNLDKSLLIVKKLKLTGAPFKVFKKTAFVKDMFSSALECAKFEGASLKTVSGIRGQIKKALSTPPGAFRATFEDKILLRDIVFVRTWLPIEVPRFYATVSNMLLNGEEKLKWTGMRTVGQLRFERGLKPPTKVESWYKPIDRKPYVPPAFNIPKDLESRLPYHVKPKHTKPTQNGQRDPLVAKHTAVILEPHESKIFELMNMLKTISKDKEKKEREEMAERAAKHRKEMEILDKKRMRREKETKKRICRTLSQRESRRTKLKA